MVNPLRLALGVFLILLIIGFVALLFWFDNAEKEVRYKKDHPYIGMRDRTCSGSCSLWEYHPEGWVKCADNIPADIDMYQIVCE